MRIAIVWNFGSALSECSFRFEEYVRALEALGHEAFVVCPRSSDDGFDVPKHTPSGDGGLESPELWAELGADVAIAPTFHQMSSLLSAIRAAGTRVIALGDSDGQVGVRAFPRTTLTRLVYGAPYSASRRLRKAGEFVSRWLRSARRIDAEDAEFLRSTELSDVVILGNSEARRHFSTFLASFDRADLSARIHVAPLAIHRAFIEWEGLGAEREQRLVAVGRWDAPQKHPASLRRALRHFLAETPDAEVDIFGPGSVEQFSDLAARHRVTCHGPSHVGQIAPKLAEAQSIVFSSRWEGSPHAATEALAMGATVVGSPIPALVSWTENERYGQVASSHSAGALAQALRREAQLWANGGRNGREIASVWRSRVSGAAVCGSMLDALERFAGESSAH